MTAYIPITSMFPRIRILMHRHSFLGKRVILVMFKLGWPMITFENIMNYRDAESELLDQIFGPQKEENMLHIALEYYQVKDGGCVHPPIISWTRTK
jgi:hypothetical protein